MTYPPKEIWELEPEPIACMTEYGGYLYIAQGNRITVICVKSPWDLIKATITAKLKKLRRK